MRSLEKKVLKYPSVVLSQPFLQVDIAQSRLAIWQRSYSVTTIPIALTVILVVQRLERNSRSTKNMRTVLSTIRSGKRGQNVSLILLQAVCELTLSQ